MKIDFGYGLIMDITQETYKSIINSLLIIYDMLLISDKNHPYNLDKNKILLDLKNKIIIKKAIYHYFKTMEEHVSLSIYEIENYIFNDYVIDEY